MPGLVAGTLAERIQQANQLLLKVTSDLPEDVLRERPSATAPSIGFHLWHIARFADRVQSTLPGMDAALEDRLGRGVELWVSQERAARWGLAGASLGRSETGLGMADDDAGKLALPAKDELLDYATQSFEALDRACAAVDDDMLDSTGLDANGREATVAGALVGHLVHASRHLGMIEGLRGTRGIRGSATA